MSTTSKPRRTYGRGAVDTFAGEVGDGECPVCYTGGDCNLIVWSGGEASSWTWHRECDDCDYEEHGRYTKRDMYEQQLHASGYYDGRY